jgi:hypothetical protein
MTQNQKNRAGRSQVQVTIARGNWREVAVSEYINQSGDIKQLSMSPWLAHYLPLSLIKAQATDAEILDAARDSVCELRAQIDKITMALQIQGLELPPGAYPLARSASASRSKPKTAKPKPQPVTVENDEDDDDDDDDFIMGFDRSKHQFDN